MSLYLWDKTAAANGLADPSCQWPEGMAPSAVNNSARGNMAAIAKYRDDTAGLIATTGTSTAYSVTSYQSFPDFVKMHGQEIAFTPHVTNGATVTLNVDGLGSKPLRTAPNTELLAGVLVQGTPYTAVYSNTDQAFYLRHIYGNPYNIPLAGGMDFWGTVVPNSSFAFPIGQAISRTTYAALFAIMGTTFGSGDGSTTFNLPDKTGRVSAMKEAAATRLTAAVSGINGAAMGAAGGSESHTLALAELPTGITSSNASQAITVSTSLHIPTSPTNYANAALANNPGGVNLPFSASSSGDLQSLSGNNSISVTSNNTGGGAHKNVQPTIVCNYIIRII